MYRNNMWEAYPAIIMIVLSTCALLFALSHLFNRKPIIIINEKGIDDKQLGVGLILWQDIRLIQFNGDPVNNIYNLIFRDDYSLGLYVNNLEKYVRNCFFIKKIIFNLRNQFGMPPFIVAFNNMSNVSTLIFYYVQDMQKKNVR